jgi:hypothetical protein
MGFTYQQIGDQLGVTRQAAHQAVMRAIDAIPKEGAADVLEMELSKLDRLERYYHTVLNKTHVRVGNNGKVVKDDNGAPILDEAPRMDASNGILKVQAQRARLLGLNAPVRTDVVVYDIERDTQKIIDAQMYALKVIGLDADQLDKFRSAFVTALGSGEGQVVDANWTTTTLVVP